MWSWLLSALLIIFVLLAPLAGEAQQAGKVWRVGVLGGISGPESARWAPFREGLREMGYVEGQNIALEWRFSGGRAERFPDLAAGLARLNVKPWIRSAPGLLVPLPSREATSLG